MATQDRMRPSDEANSEQITLAERQGRTFQDAVRDMSQREAHGETRVSGDYLVGLAQEHAEGMYEWRGGRLEWQDPGEENAHFEVVVQEASDRRFVPGLRVRVTVTAPDGREVGTHVHPFLWHPWLYHYGRNWQVPGDGEYTVRVHVDPPEFPRHDRTNGRKFEQPADVVFERFKVETGRKMSKPE